MKFFDTVLSLDLDMVPSARRGDYIVSVQRLVNARTWVATLSRGTDLPPFAGPCAATVAGDALIKLERITQNQSIKEAFTNPAPLRFQNTELIKAEGYWFAQRGEFIVYSHFEGHCWITHLPSGVRIASRFTKSAQENLNELAKDYAGTAFE